jgi:hypothetical protein
MLSSPEKMSLQDMARHASQAVLPRVIGSFGDSVKYYFRAKNRITEFLQRLIYTVIFYHIFFRCFLKFYRFSPIAFAV